MTFANIKQVFGNMLSAWGDRFCGIVQPSFTEVIILNQLLTPEQSLAVNSLSGINTAALCPLKASIMILVFRSIRIRYQNRRNPRAVISASVAAPARLITAFAAAKAYSISSK